MDIHKMVTGFPKIKNVLAFERSVFVNQRLNKMIMEGITALSTTPSIKRMTIKRLTLFVMPVAIAQAPQSSKDQKINFLALRVAA